MRSSVRTLAVAAASVALLATAACGGSSDKKADAKSSTSASPSPSASASASTSPSALPTYSPATTKKDRPGKAVLSAALVKGSASSGQGYTKAQADCVATTLRQSTVSNVALKAIVTLDPSFTASAADNTALQAVASKLSACSTAK